MILAHSIPFDPAHDADAFAQIPSAPGVFILRAADPAAEPYVSKSANLKRRIMRLLAPPESQSRRLNLRELCKQIEFTATGSDFENVLLLYRTLKDIFPEAYTKRLRLNHAAVIRIHWENTYPRAYVTRKLTGLSGRKKDAANASIYYGPFRSRAEAEKYLNDTLDLFKSRRCTFELNPDPAFPGCVYSEMKMCLAPCFKGCTDEDYLGEVRRVQKFLDSRGESLIHELEAEREKASAELEFEAAAAVHAKVEKVRGVVRGMDEAVGRLDQLDAIIIQPSTRPNEVSLFRFTSGQLCGPHPFRVENILLSNQRSGDSSLYAQPMMMQPVPEGPPVTAASAPASLESRLSDAVDEIHAPAKCTASAFTENLALLKRWYYKSSRVGEVFFADAAGKFPMRKVAKGLSRVLVGMREKPLTCDARR